MLDCQTRRISIFLNTPQTSTRAKIGPMKLKKQCLNIAQTHSLTRVAHNHLSSLLSSLLSSQLSSQLSSKPTGPRLRLSYDSELLLLQKVTKCES